MGKYRTYKNGITGHRYKGYYIIKGEEKGKFAIWNEDKTVFQDNILDYDECEWIIDKETADRSTTIMLEMLYEKDIFELNGLALEIMCKKDRQGTLEPKSQNLYDWTIKVRNRKVKQRKF